MGRPERFTTERVIDALRATRGMKTLAARQLGTNLQTVQRYIDKYPTVKAAFEEVQEQTGDIVELKLLEKVNQGDTAAIIFALKTRFRNRGYSEKMEIGIDMGQVREVIEAIRMMGQTPGDVFGEIIRLAHNQRVAQDVDSE